MYCCFLRRIFARVFFLLEVAAYKIVRYFHIILIRILLITDTIGTIVLIFNPVDVVTVSTDHSMSVKTAWKFSF